METELPDIAGTADGSLVPPPTSSPALGAFLLERKLSRQTLAQLRVGSATDWFPDAEKKLPSIRFKYREGYKARSYPDKYFVSGKGFKLSFWNLDAVLNGPLDTVFITEGEFDACALVEAGIPPDRVLSVPNGANEKRDQDIPADEVLGYQYVKEALAEGLARAKKFVWCGDSDGAGAVLRADMVKLLGAARFHFVNWPEGCKDANDVLKTDGPEFLHDLVCHGSLPWPVKGLYVLSDLPEPPPLIKWYPFQPLSSNDVIYPPDWKEKLALAPTTLSVASGHPGMGKTQCWNYLWYRIVRQYDQRACLASFETGIKPHVRRQIRTLYSGKLEKDMSDAEKSQADRWINDHYLFMVHPDQTPDLKWFLEMAEVAVIRHGVRIFVLDPWNRMESQAAPGEHKSDYVLRCLRTMAIFCKDFNCHVQIIAHPSKMDSSRRGTAPLLEDISDSKSWDTVVDSGFVIHRPSIYEGANRKTEVDFHYRKSRFAEELGYPCVLKMKLNLSNGCYEPDFSRA